MLASLVEGEFMTRILRALRHVRSTILRPSVQTYQEARHVGTEGGHDLGEGECETLWRLPTWRVALTRIPSLFGEPLIYK